MTSTKKQTATPADALAAIREQNATDEFDTVATIDGILSAEDAVTGASALLGERLAASPNVAAELFGIRGAAAKVAVVISKQHGISKNAAEARVSRIVKVGRVLAQFPTLDPLAVYAATNRMTGEQVDAVLAAKNADAAVKMLEGAKTAKKDAGKKDPGKRGPGKKTGGEKTRTLHEDAVSLTQALAAFVKRAGGMVEADPATVADDASILLESLSVVTKNLTVMRDGAVSEVARRAEAQ